MDVKVVTFRWGFAVSPLIQLHHIYPYIHLLINERIIAVESVCLIVIITHYKVFVTALTVFQTVPILSFNIITDSATNGYPMRPTKPIPHLHRSI